MLSLIFVYGYIYFFINIGLNAENFCNRYMIGYMSLLIHCIFTCNFFVNQSSDFENTPR